MNISSSDSVHMQSLQTYTVLAGKTHEPGNAERLNEEMTSSFEPSPSLVSLLYADVKRDEQNQIDPTRQTI